ncbi:sucrose transporter [Pseudomassariella vexata]|uniref:Sucrose transporter n=1 Tax=Pseudomassariella vexata TaxID=1141098 RepID=A0A1Y2E3B9_9PEZI|nr:sucrose transporter [Pseudomassariella vexata]ORY65806.1 sucrose transporter [Pseudomassariella vexata]
MSRWSGQPSIKGSSDALRMILLNFSTLDCTPYLLSLGLTKSKTSLVWIAGPLSGLLVQPIVGATADGSTSRWGRRPFIVVGAVMVAICLLILGFTREIVGLFIPDETAAKTPTIVVAIISIYAVDFSINAVMSAARSLVVDTLPISRQQDGAAWGGRMSAIGIFGNFLGHSQFKRLTFIAALGILCSCFVTSWAVTERVLVAVKHDPRNKGGRFKVVVQIWSTLLHLPPRIRAICHVQFWSWVGWFPFLFYNTTWVGETYFRYDVPEDARGSEDVLGQMGRIGSTALVIYSIITLIGAWTLPLLVKSPEADNFTPRPPQSIAPIIEKINKYKPDLLTTWMVAHGMFACAMFVAPFAHSFKFATALICICGLPWTIAMWAPPTFLGIEVNKLSGATQSNPSYRRLSNESVEIEDEFDGGLSGIYFGILNIYTTLPQFVGTFISTVVFAILEPGMSAELAHEARPDEHHSADGPNAIAVCLFIGAMSATVGIFATWKLRYL